MSFPKHPLEYYGNLHGELKYGSYGEVTFRGNYAIKRMELEDHDDTACREIALILRLNHPQIISIEDVIVIDNSINIVMPIWGDTIYRRILPEDRISVMNQLVEGVKYIHSRGIVHLDLKPQNILIKDGQIKIIDFGIALPIELAQPGLVCTIWYRPPEVELGYSSGYYTDIWSLGCILYEIFVESTLFINGEDNLLKYIFKEFGTPCETLHPEALEYPKWNGSYKKYPGTMNFVKNLAMKTDPIVCEIICKMLRFNPHERYLSSQEQIPKTEQNARYYHSKQLQKIFEMMINLGIPLDVYFRASLFSRMIDYPDESIIVVMTLIHIADNFKIRYPKILDIPPVLIKFRAIEICRLLDYNIFPTTCYDLYADVEPINGLVRSQFPEGMDLSFLKGTPYE